MEIFKRFFNVIFAWFVVLWAPVFAITFCLGCMVYKVMTGNYPSDQCELFFRMLCFGEDGLFEVGEEEDDWDEEDYDEEEEEGEEDEEEEEED